MEHSCTHVGFQGIRSEYDRGGAVLVFHWVCEECGIRLREARREEYRPQFVPHGDDLFAGQANAEAKP